MYIGLWTQPSVFLTLLVLYGDWVSAAYAIWSFRLSLCYELHWYSGFTSPLIQHHFTVNFILPRNSLHLELGFYWTSQWAMLHFLSIFYVTSSVPSHWVSIAPNNFTLLQVFTRFSLNFTSRQTSIQLGLNIGFHLHSRRFSLSLELHFIRL